MGNDFNFVKDGLEKVSIGIKYKREILSAISEFKESLVKAFCEKYGVAISFDDSFQALLSSLSRFRDTSIMRGLPGSVESPNSPTQMRGDVVVYVHDRGVRIFGYELNPVTGYPVNLMYMGKTVECDSKAGLIGAIKEAYEYALVDLTNLCKDISTK